MGKSWDHSSAFIFDRIFFILAGNEENHNISNDFEIQADRTMGCGVAATDRLENPHRLIMGKMS